MSEKNQIMINEYPSYEKVLQIVIEQKLPFTQDPLLGDYSEPIHELTKSIWESLHDISEINKYANMICSPPPHHGEYYWEFAFHQLQTCFYIILAPRGPHK